MRPTVYNRVLLFLSFAGIFVAGVLSMAEQGGKDVPCGASHGCATVAADPSSHMLGIPNAYLGFFGYVVLAILASYREFAGMGNRIGRSTVYIGYAAAAIGTLASVYLTYISITQIQATCIWCLTSAVIMTLTLLAYMMLGSEIDKPQAESPAGRVGIVLVPVLAICALAGVLLVSKNMNERRMDRWNPKAADIANLVGPSAHVLNPNGVVTLVEFGDLDCPNCKHLYPQIEQLIANSNGKLRYVFHHYPLYMNSEHPGALPGAVIAEMAAEHGDFWKFLQLVYEGSDDPHAPVASPEDMIRFGKQLGLNESEMRKRMGDKDDPARVRVQDDLGLVDLYKVRFTPTFIIMAEGHDTVEIPGAGVFQVLEKPEFAKLLAGN